MKTKIELNEVATVIERRGVDLQNPADVTAFNAQARMVAMILTGKKKAYKQDVEQVLKHMTTLWGQTHSGGKAEQTIADFEECVDDFRTEPRSGDDEAAGDEGVDATAPVDGTHTVPQPDEDGEFGGEDEGEEAPEQEDGEAKVEASVVKRKYRDKYKQQGHARGNGDWLFMALRALCNGAKGKLVFPNWEAICEANNLGKLCASYSTPEKQMNNGWQGRCRMSVGIKLREGVAQDAVLIVPKDLWDASAERIAKANAEGSKWAFHIEIDESEDDAIVVLRAPRSFTDEVLAKAANRVKEAN